MHWLPAQPVFPGLGWHCILVESHHSVPRGARFRLKKTKCQGTLFEITVQFQSRPAGSWEELGSPDKSPPLRTGLSRRQWGCKDDRESPKDPELRDDSPESEKPATLSWEEKLRICLLLTRRFSLACAPAVPAHQPWGAGGPPTNRELVLDLQACLKTLVCEGEAPRSTSFPQDKNTLHPRSPACLLEKERRAGEGQPWGFGALDSGVSEYHGCKERNVILSTEIQCQRTSFPGGGVRCLGKFAGQKRCLCGQEITSKKKKKMVEFSSVSNEVEWRECENKRNPQREHTSHTLPQGLQPGPGGFDSAQCPVRRYHRIPKLSAYRNLIPAESNGIAEEHDQVSALKSPSFLSQVGIAGKLLEISRSNLKKLDWVFVQIPNWTETPWPSGTCLFFHNINIYCFIWILYWKPKHSVTHEIIQLYTASQRQWTHYSLQNLLYRNLKILNIKKYSWRNRYKFGSQ